MNGKLIHVGQNNRDKFYKGIVKCEPCYIECPARFKSIACGSNHTIGVKIFFRLKKFI